MHSSKRKTLMHSISRDNGTTFCIGGVTALGFGGQRTTFCKDCLKMKFYPRQSTPNISACTFSVFVLSSSGISKRSHFGGLAICVLTKFYCICL